MLNLNWWQCLFCRQDAGGNRLGRNELNIKDNPSLNLNYVPNLKLTLHLTPKRKLWKVLKKVQKMKRELAKVRVELKSNCIPDVKHNRYTTSSMPIAWQTDLFIRIASCHETECSSGGTIALTDLLPPESWRWNRHYLNWYQNIWSIDIGQGSLTYMASRQSQMQIQPKKTFHSAW